MSNFQKTVSAVEDLIRKRELQQKENFRQISIQAKLKEDNEKLEQNETRQVDRSRWKKPTHFISLQITNPEIITKIAEVQKDMKKKNELLELSQVRLSCAHITLRVARLETEDDLTRMKKSLDECVEQFNKENMDLFRLTFRGIGNFRNGVVFAKIQRDKNYFRLQRLGEIFEDCCKANGASFKKEGRFNPHLTIAKISQLVNWLELIEDENEENFAGTDKLLVKICQSIKSELCRGSSTLEISPKSNTAEIPQGSITSETFIEPSKSNIVRGFDASEMLQGSCSYVQYPVPNSSDMYSESSMKSDICQGSSEHEICQGASKSEMCRESSSPEPSRELRAYSMGYTNDDSKEGASLCTMYDMVPDFSPKNLNRRNGFNIQRLFTGLQCLSCGQRFKSSEKIKAHLSDCQQPKKAKRNEWWPKINTFLESSSVNELCLGSAAYLLHYIWVVWRYKQQHQQDTIDIREIDPSTYSNYRNQLFGNQQITCLQLCSMKSDDSGYYHMEHVTKL
ncbi:AKAP7 [Mytilus coruscus]|uniref:AKAP7 n=1 Tax=Mytilus coruscus TaxID=42192 RepID=A0A6J8DSL4_MYTCO|nr:AKAP7 [Mytilus coruscus]